LKPSRARCRRGILEPLIETRLDCAAGTPGRLAERRGREPAETDAYGPRASRSLMSEPEARGPAELESTAARYEHARPIIDPERQWNRQHTEAGVADLDRHRLSLDDEDHARFAGMQKAIVESTTDPTFVRYRRARLDADRAMEARGIDTDNPEARLVRANVRGQLGGFDAIEGRTPNGQDIDDIVNSEVSGLELGDSDDSFNLFPPKPGDPGSTAVHRPGEQNTTDGLFHQIQAVGDNYRQGRAAELTVLEEIKKLLPEPRSATHIRLYVEGGPRYMVGDIAFSPNGTSLIVLEVKSGMAERSALKGSSRRST